MTTKMNINSHPTNKNKINQNDNQSHPANGQAMQNGSQPSNKPSNYSKTDQQDRTGN
jgi:hypothetical protein